MFRNVLVAYDGSEGATRALRAGLDLARATGARLTALAVRQHLPYFATSVDEVDEAREQIEAFFQRIMTGAARMAAEAGIELATVVRPGHEVETIVAYAKETGCDLLIVGFRGHGNVFGRIMGGTAQNLARLAPCPVLIVK